MLEPSMSDLARRRIATLLLVAGIVVAALAIADLGPFRDPPTTEDHVAATVEEFFGAAAEGDFRAFCALLTPDARETLRRNAARLGGVDANRGCARTLGAVVGEALEGSRYAVREVSVSGPRARVEARFRPPDAQPELRTVYLNEIDGEWLVDDPGG
jgi:hypothetical protein